jgi:hypothetical protein
VYVIWAANEEEQWRCSDKVKESIEGGIHGRLDMTSNANSLVPIEYGCFRVKVARSCAKPILLLSMIDGVLPQYHHLHSLALSTGRPLQKGFGKHPHRLSDVNTGIRRRDVEVEVHSKRGMISMLLQAYLHTHVNAELCLLMAGIARMPIQRQAKNDCLASLQLLYYSLHVIVTIDEEAFLLRDRRKLNILRIKLLLHDLFESLEN